jgi:hypothetical protein
MPENIDEQQNKELYEDPTEPQEQEVEEESWFSLILNFPFIGDLVATLIAIAPSVLIIAVLEIFVDTDSQEVTKWAVLVMLPPLYFWLKFLEKRFGFVPSLPIPVFNIKLKWALLPFGLWWIYLLYTGQAL